MTGAPATIADIKHMLQARVVALVQELLPTARQAGGGIADNAESRDQTMARACGVSASEPSML